MGEPTGIPPDALPRLVTSKAVAVADLSFLSNPLSDYDGGVNGSSNGTGVDDSNNRALSQAVVDNAVSIDGGRTLRVDWARVGSALEATRRASSKGERTVITAEDARQAFIDLCSQAVAASPTVNEEKRGTGNGSQSFGGGNLLGRIVATLDPSVLSAAVSAAASAAGVQDRSNSLGATADATKYGVVAAAKFRALRMSEEAVVRGVALRAELLGLKVGQVEERLGRVRDLERLVEAEREEGGRRKRVGGGEKTKKRKR